MYLKLFLAPSAFSSLLIYIMRKRNKKQKEEKKGKKARKISILYRIRKTTNQIRDFYIMFDE